MASTPAFLTRVPERIRKVLVRASPEVLSRAEAPDEWEAVFSDQDDELKDAWFECQDEIDHIVGGRPDPEADGSHRLGGHRTWMLEHGIFRPPDGYSKDLKEYELLLRLDLDNQAGFDWGSNVAYVVIHRDDLAAGRLERAFDAPANA